MLSTHHFHHHTFHEFLRLNSKLDLHYCHMQTSPLGHVHFSELQPILQSHRNISSNLGSTGGKSVVLGSSLNSAYLHPHSIASIFSHSPYSLGNILSDCGIVLQLRLVVTYMILLRLKISSPFRSIIHNASCRGHPWPIHCTHKEVLPLRLLQCPLEECCCHYRI